MAPKGAKEPPAKKAKVGEEGEEKAEAIEEPKEKEPDAAPITGATLKEPIVFAPCHSTLNVVSTLGGQLLRSLSDGGMQYLIAGARANVGVKSGRYLYEVKVLEELQLHEATGKSRPPMPKQLVRIGFSTASSSLLLGDGGGSIYFDGEGFFHLDGKREGGAKRANRDQVIAVLLNLDASSPNANTFSVFSNGERICDPKPLPEGLKGKTLFPHVAYRSMSVHVNFGPEPLKALPFKCHTLQGASTKDVETVKVAPPKDGKYEVVFPVGFPDEGTFTWLDAFLAKNPSYVELSDRRIIEWATKSGMFKPKSGWKSSGDKPEFNFGLPMMDDYSVQRALNSIATVVPRNYVVMEVKQNLCKADRMENVKRFSAPHFKKVARVIMGEPGAEHKQLVRSRLLELKKEKAEIAWKQRKLEKARKKAMEKRQKEVAKAQAERKRKAEEARQRLEEKKKAEQEKKEEGAEKKEDAPMPDADKAEEKPEEKPEEKAEEKEEEEEEEEDEPMPEVTLSAEEAEKWFCPPAVPDLTPQVLEKCFIQFSLPQKEEGFDNIAFEWQQKDASTEYLNKWVLEKKRTSRIDDISPGDWFKSTMPEFMKSLSEWEEKQKVPARKTEEEEAMDTASIDIFTVEDVCNAGNGEALFKNFSFEDWALVALRVEFYLLLMAFKKDVDDADRVVNENHCAYYYQRYFLKPLTPKNFGKENLKDMLVLIKDTVIVEGETITLKVDDELDSPATFVKMAESMRRERQRRIDAGDETARLRFMTAALRQAMKGSSDAGAKTGGASGNGVVPGGGSWNYRGGRYQAAPKKW